MIVLGFDTATPATAVALRLTEDATLEARDDPDEERRPGHATRLLPLASALLAQAGLGWGEIQRIAVGVGPGTFTGLRIGVASARALAQSLELELVGVSSSRALAHALPAEDGAGTLSVIDARRGEVFLAAYRGEGELLAPQPFVPGELDGVLEEIERRARIERWVALGDGAVRYRDVLARPNVRVLDANSQLHRISGEAICALGADADVLDTTAVLPDYRRRPDAELALEGAGEKARLAR
jgi:tRNA threonylcarbamoyladenosine biosynthesis protein TsaB